MELVSPGPPTEAKATQHPDGILRLPVLGIWALRELGPAGFPPPSTT